MNVMTIRQFAEDQHVSYEAIRRQLVIYRKQLEGHIIRDKQYKLLDEYAVEFLRTKRRHSPIVAINQEREETIDTLKNNLVSAQNMIVELQQQLDEMKNLKLAMIETETRYKMALEQLTQEKELLAQAKEQAEEARAETEAARQALDSEREKLYAVRAELKNMELRKELLEKEANSYHKSIFGFYRKK